jgi:hypothetical protein
LSAFTVSTHFFTTDYSHYGKHRKLVRIYEDKKARSGEKMEKRRKRLLPLLVSCAEFSVSVCAPTGVKSQTTKGPHACKAPEPFLIAPSSLVVSNVFNNLGNLLFAQRQPQCNEND